METEIQSALIIVALVALVAFVEIFFDRPFGRRIARFAPEPFWIYFLSIAGGLTGLLPAKSSFYSLASGYLLPMAIFLMLVGSPITMLLRLGARASAAMALASVTMVAAVVGVFAVFHPFLPEGAWRGAGALLATWVGGSANMVAVKEILQMPDGDMAPLIIVDTILSYSWLALLLLGAALQLRFDANVTGSETSAVLEKPVGRTRVTALTALPIAIALAAALACVAAGRRVAGAFPVVPAGGWTLLLATLVAMGAALTPLRGVEVLGASIVGRWALYVVLATIGAKTRLESAASAPIFLAYGAVVLLVHGVLLFALGRLFRLRLFLLSTASQAAVGGAVSAPIVAEAYRPGTSSIGVLMAVAGALFGTYVGVAGGVACRQISAWLH